MKNAPDQGTVISPVRGDLYQTEAIQHYRGPCLVLAGPGSGKTFVLTHRILNLIGNRRVSPSSILVLTFSKAAALEMQDRFASLSGSANSGVVFGTFHSVYFRILQLSSPIRLSVLLPSEQTQLVRHLVMQFRDKITTDEESAAEAAVSGIALVKTTDSLSLPDDPRYQSMLKLFGSEAVFRTLYDSYELFLRENGKIDFEDMIRKCRVLLENNAQILNHFRDRFRFILVDEFQDVNPEQYGILKLLAGQDRNLFVVGDDDQSIYGFRGAAPSICRSFLLDYPDAVKVCLGVNYRCSEAITKAAVRVISCNHDRISKTINADHKGGTAVQILSAASNDEEYRIIADRLLNLTAESQRNTAVIFRNHLQAKLFERFLEDRNIPVHSNGNTDDRTARNIRQIVCSYYRTSISFFGREDHLAQRSDLYKIMNLPQRYILRSIIRSEKVSPGDLMDSCKGQNEMLFTIRRFLTDLRRMYDLPPKLSVRYLRFSIGLEQALIKGKESEKAKRIADYFNVLESEAKDIRTAADFAERLEHDCPPRRKNSEEGINILTMHASKGLEFDRCFLPDLNEGILPGRGSITESAAEEERRLFYVAMTRARKELYLSYITGTPDNPRRPSRFLEALGIRDRIR